VDLGSKSNEGEKRQICRSIVLLAVMPRPQKFLIWAGVAVVAVAVLILVVGYFSTSDFREREAVLQPLLATNAPPALSRITNTVDAKTTFRIFRRRPDNNHWDTGNAYAYTNGVALLKALVASKQWEGKSHAAAYGQFHAHTPGIKITIDWSRTKEERKAHSVTFCYGNRLFWYGDSVYQIPETSYELVDRLFPKNKDG
jgi:hypothetical protein